MVKWLLPFSFGSGARSETAGKSLAEQARGGCNMKRTILATMALSLLSGTVALAHSPQDHHHDRDQRQDERHAEHRDRDEHHDQHMREREEHRVYAEERIEHDRYDHHDRGGDRDDYRGEMHGHGYFNSRVYVRPHGYFRHHWHRGDRLPRDWRGPGYVIPDYDYYRLPPPPPGYYWVRVDDNAVLAVIATGVVANVVHNLFH
jgi:Ni/Co efflux regulator RcnB